MVYKSLVCHTYRVHAHIIMLQMSYSSNIFGFGAFKWNFETDDNDTNNSILLGEKKMLKLGKNVEHESKLSRNHSNENSFLTWSEWHTCILLSLDIGHFHLKKTFSKPSRHFFLCICNHRKRVSRNASIGLKATNTFHSWTKLTKQGEKNKYEYHTPKKRHSYN